MTDTDTTPAPSLADHLAAARTAYPKPEVRWTPGTDPTHDGHEEHEYQSGREVARAVVEIYDATFEFILMADIIGTGEEASEAFRIHAQHADGNVYGSVTDRFGTLTEVLQGLDDYLTRRASEVQEEAAIVSYAEALLTHQNLLVTPPVPVSPPGPSEDAGLAALEVTDSPADRQARGELSPAFDRNTLHYGVAGRGLITLNATPSDEGATLDWSSADRTGTGTFFRVSVPTTGQTRVTLLVTAADGITRRTYSFNLTPEGA